MRLGGMTDEDEFIYIEEKRFKGCSCYCRRSSLSLTPAFNTPQFAVYAEETKEDVQQQKDEAEAGQAEAEANAAKYQKQVDSLVKTVTELDAQMTDISVQIVEKSRRRQTSRQRLTIHRRSWLQLR